MGAVMRRRGESVFCAGAGGSRRKRPQRRPCKNRRTRAAFERTARRLWREERPSTSRRRCGGRCAAATPRMLDNGPKPIKCVLYAGTVYLQPLLKYGANTPLPHHFRSNCYKIFYRRRTERQQPGALKIKKQIRSNRPGTTRVVFFQTFAYLFL